MGDFVALGAQGNNSNDNTVIQLNDSDNRIWKVKANGTTDNLELSKSGVAMETWGQGGAVTQITNAGTGVTLSKRVGQITTVALTTAAAAIETFVVTNTECAANDIVAVSTTYAGAGKPVVFVTAVSAGAFTVNIVNVHASAALNAALVVNFKILKGATS